MKKTFLIRREDLKVGTRITYRNNIDNELVWEISAVHQPGYDIDTGRLCEDIEYDVIPVLNNPRRKRIGLKIIDISRNYVIVTEDL